MPLFLQHVAGEPVRAPSSQGMKQSMASERVSPTLRSLWIVFCVTLATLAAIEVMLRVADLRILREGASERSLTYRYDAELGWAPIPNSSSAVTTARTIHARHNSLGFRDIEFKRDDRPTMLFVGDSFVWGVDAEADERFTDLLRSRLSGPLGRQCRRVGLRHRSGISVASADMADDPASSGRPDILRGERPAG